MYQPSQQKLGAILQNDGRKILDAIQSSLELSRPSQVQSRRIWGENGFKGGVTSTCSTLVHASWQRLTSRTPLPTLQPYGLLSPQEELQQALIQSRPQCPPCQRVLATNSNGVHMAPSLLAPRVHVLWGFKGWGHKEPQIWVSSQQGPQGPCKEPLPGHPAEPGGQSIK